MGCDITIISQAELDLHGKVWVDVRPSLSGLPYRNYEVFGWLADVRNYSAVGPISPLRGFPEGYNPPDIYKSMKSTYSVHSESWLSYEDFAAVDYDQIVEDRYVEVDHVGSTCAPGEGKKLPLREFLGPEVMDDIAFIVRNRLRLVFWFDG